MYESRVPGLSWQKLSTTASMLPDSIFKLREPAFVTRRWNNDGLVDGV
jgi:hypothetical protein